MKYTIKDVKLTNKEGQEFFTNTKYGRKQKLAIQVEEKPDLWLWGFYNITNSRWEKGDQVEIEITSREFNGKTYHDFRMPPQTVSREEFQALVARVKALESKNGDQGEAIEPLDDIPF
jgi:hypothetical protein